MCKRVQNNHICDHVTTTHIPVPGPYPLDFSGAHSITWEQISHPYPCIPCINRFDTHVESISTYISGLTAAFTPILQDLTTCDAIHKSVTDGIYNRHEFRVMTRAFNRCINILFAAEQIAEGFHDLYKLRCDLISEMQDGVEGEESWQMLDTLKGLDNALEARLSQTNDWNANFGIVVTRFLAPWRFWALREKAIVFGPEGVKARYVELCSADSE